MKIVMNKTAVISDIHGNIEALEAVTADIKRKGVDTVINLGDNASGPLWPQETIQYLMKQNWIQIAGNCDREITVSNPDGLGLSDKYACQHLNDIEKEWLKSLPAVKVYKDEILICHGTPQSDLINLLETIENGVDRLSTQSEILQKLNGTKSNVILCGHSHIPRAVKVDENILIVNPGSVGLPAFTDDKPEPHVMVTGSPDARYAIIEYADNKWIVDLISVPYDNKKAVQQAKKNNRLEWEISLMTGFMDRLSF